VEDEGKVHEVPSVTRAWGTLGSIYNKSVRYVSSISKQEYEAHEVPSVPRAWDT
jgi:hypothetical protein